MKNERYKFKVWADKIWIGYIVFLVVAGIAFAIAALCTGIGLFARNAVTFLDGSVLVLVIGDTIKKGYY